MFSVISGTHGFHFRYSFYSFLRIVSDIPVW